MTHCSSNHKRLATDYEQATFGSTHGRGCTFCSNVSQKLSSSREELYSGEYDNFTRTIVLVLAHGSVGQVARTNFFEVMLRVRY